MRSIMNRREVLGRFALLVGGAVIGNQLLLESCGMPARETTMFTDKQIDLLGDIAEVILPKTTVPGAKEAGVGPFISVMIEDCYTAEDQGVFLKGLQEIDELSHTMFQKSFQKLPFVQQTELVEKVGDQADNYNKNKKSGEPKHYFNMIKELTLLGYFTSEPGSTEALRYIQIPGRYDGDVPYEKGDRAWA